MWHSYTIWCRLSVNAVGTCSAPTTTALSSTPCRASCVLETYEQQRICWYQTTEKRQRSPQASYAEMRMNVLLCAGPHVSQATFFTCSEDTCMWAPCAFCVFFNFIVVKQGLATWSCQVCLKYCVVAHVRSMIALLHTTFTKKAIVPTKATTFISNRDPVICSG